MMVGHPAGHGRMFFASHVSYSLYTENDTSCSKYSSMTWILFVACIGASDIKLARNA